MSRAAKAKKAKNKAADARLKKAAKGKGKAKAAQEAQDDFAAALGTDDEDDEDVPAPEPTASSSKTTYLDPDLFASAATFYEPEQQPAAGQGKMAAKRLARLQKQERAAALQERAEELKEGGSRNVGYALRRICRLCPFVADSPSRLPSQQRRNGSAPRHTIPHFPFALLHRSSFPHERHQVPRQPSLLQEASDRRARRWQASHERRVGTETQEEGVGNECREQGFARDGDR